MSTTTSVPLTPPGKFVVFEGPDGCGKSTQLESTAMYLDQILPKRLGTHTNTLLLRSPGGSPLAEVVRAQVLSREGLPNSVRLHGMLLAMLSTTLELVQPAIASGRWVLMDRFLLSALIYQGLLAGNSVYEVNEAIASVFKSVDLKPTAYMVFNVSPETSLKRIADRNDTRTVFETEALVRRMNPAYQFARSLVQEPVFYIDGEGTIEEVWRRTKMRVDSLLTP